MNPVEIYLYSYDFNVISNYGSLHRIIRSILLTVVAVGVIIIVPLTKEFAILIVLGILFGGMFISDKYLRKIYADWPKSKNFIGTINFSTDSMTIKEGNKVNNLPISECNELIIFLDHYTDYSVNQRDIKRNGNGLLFLKNKLEQISVYKFNINNESQFNEIQVLIDHYKEIVPYFKKYMPYEIPHILKADLSERIKYR